MLRGYRLYIAALGLALTGAAPPNEKPVGKAPAQQVSPSPSPTPDYSPYPDKQAESCYDSKDHDTADLCAQWRAAVAAEKAANIGYWGNWIGALGGLLSFASVVLVIFALRQTERSLESAKEANKIAKDIAARQLRAYVSVSKIAVSPFKAGYLPMFYLELTNNGQTPAKDIMLISQVFFVPSDEEGEFCVRFDEGFDECPRTNIGSGQCFTEYHELNSNITKHHISEIRAERIVIFFAGVAKYKDIFGRRRLLTFKVRYSPSVRINGNMIDLSPCPRGNASN